MNTDGVPPTLVSTLLYTLRESGRDPHTIPDLLTIDDVASGLDENLKPVTTFRRPSESGIDSFFFLCRTKWTRVFRSEEW